MRGAPALRATQRSTVRISAMSLFKSPVSAILRKIPRDGEVRGWGFAVVASGHAHDAPTDLDPLAVALDDAARATASPHRDVRRRCSARASAASRSRVAAASSNRSSSASRCMRASSGRERDLGLGRERAPNRARRIRRRSSSSTWPRHGHAATPSCAGTHGGPVSIGPRRPSGSRTAAAAPPTRSPRARGARSSSSGTARDRSRRRLRVRVTVRRGKRSSVSLR